MKLYNYTILDYGPILHGQQPDPNSYNTVSFSFNANQSYHQVIFYSLTQHLDIPYQASSLFFAFYISICGYYCFHYMHVTNSALV